MKTSMFTKALALILAVMCAAGSLGISVSAAGGDGGSGSGSGSSFESMNMYLNSKSYAEYIATHADKQPGGSLAAADLSTAQTQDGAGNDTTASDLITTVDQWNGIVGTGNAADFSATAADPYVYLSADGSVTFKVDVDSPGMYYIRIKYFTLQGSVSGIERQLLIDGTIPFSEARYLALSKVWSYNYNTAGSTTYPVYKDESHTPTPGDDKHFQQDIIGNTLTPEIVQEQTWRTYFCMDAEGYIQEYYEFYFSGEEHTITLTAEREAIILGGFELVPTNSSETGVKIPSYTEYINAATSAGATAPSGVTKYPVIEAEAPDAVSDSAIYMTNDRTSSITSPSVSNAQLYNVIGANSFSGSGQWASYNFKVSADGLYDMILRYKQSALEGMYICRAIKLWSSDGMYGLPDGTPTVPFKEAYNTQFNYDTDWQVSRVGDGNHDFKFYFREGVDYTVSFEVSLGSLAEQLKVVSDTLEVLNDAYLKIIQLTGSSPDQYRDYQFDKIMPDVVRSLAQASVDLTLVMRFFEEISDSTGAHLANLQTIALLLSDMGTDHTKIAEKLPTMKTYLGTLGTWLNSSRASSLTIDTITIAPSGDDKAVPKADSNFFQSFWFEMKAFFYSFFTEYDQMGVTNEADRGEEALDIWLASGRDQNKIWRSLIDSQFTEYCRANGVSSIPINLKLITPGTLLPSILADKGPDVYMGLDSATTINYAIRNAVIPVYNKDDPDFLPGALDYLMNEDIFDPAAINTIELLGNIYGIPMTMNFNMLFYRVDVLTKLELDIPKVWDDILSMLPVLQANNLEAGLGNTAPGSGGSLFEILLYQHGASMWKYDDSSIYGGAYAGAQIGLDTSVALDVFDYYCRFFTDYGFSYTYDAANRFRTGEMPVMIGDYVGVYNQLVVFATEIAGLWEFSSIPGTRQQDGSINNNTIATVSNIVMPRKDSRDADDTKKCWEYMKWVSSADAQSNYGNRMVALLGPSAKYAAANKQAIDKLSWTTAEKNSIKLQISHLDSIKNYPGSYIIARYVEFAFLAAYNVNTKKIGENPVDAMNGYISAINKELTRKRSEFDKSGLKTLEQGQTPDQAEAARGE